MMEFGKKNFYLEHTFNTPNVSKAATLPAMLSTKPNKITTNSKIPISICVSSYDSQKQVFKTFNDREELKGLSPTSHKEHIYNDKGKLYFPSNIERNQIKNIKKNVSQGTSSPTSDESLSLKFPCKQSSLSPLMKLKSGFKFGSFGIKKSSRHETVQTYVVSNEVAQKKDEINASKPFFKTTSIFQKNSNQANPDSKEAKKKFSLKSAFTSPLFKKKSNTKELVKPLSGDNDGDDEAETSYEDCIESIITNNEQISERKILVKISQNNSSFNTSIGYDNQHNLVDDSNEKIKANERSLYNGDKNYLKEKSSVEYSLNDIKASIQGAPNVADILNNSFCSSFEGGLYKLV